MDAEKMAELLKAKGFDSLEDALGALDKTKADLSKHKTRATDLEELQNRLKSFEDEKRARDDAEKTESEKLAAKVAELETAAKQAQAEAAKAKRTALMEKGLGEHLGSVPDKLRALASEHLRVILPTKDWQDEETLTAVITESLGKFTELAPEHLRPAVPAGVPPKRGPDDMPPIDDGSTRTGFSFLKAVRGEK